MTNTLAPSTQPIPHPTRHNTLYTNLCLFGIAAFSYVYIEFLSVSEAGFYTSIGIGAALILLSSYRLSYGILATLTVSALTPEFPRNIMDVYRALLIEESVEYNVIPTTTIGPIDILGYLLLFNTLLSFLRLTRLDLSRNKALTLLTLFTIGLGALLYDVMFAGRPLIWGPIIVNAKLPIYLTFGLIQGTYLRQTQTLHLLFKLLLLLPVIIGLRVLLFLSSDALFGGIGLDLMTKPLISIGALLYVMGNGLPPLYRHAHIRILFAASLFTSNRGEMIVIGLMLLAYLAYTFHIRTTLKIRILLESGLLFVAVLAVVAVANPRLFMFLEWKSSDIQVLAGESPSDSGLVRIYELKNITSEMANDPVIAFIGKGFGGSFTFRAHPLPLVGQLGLSSYSAAELATDTYYNPHFFATIILLKYGLAGLVIYLSIPLYIALKSHKSLSPNSYATLASALSISMIYSYHWRAELMILLGLLYGALPTATSNEFPPSPDEKPIHQPRQRANMSTVKK